MHKSLLLWEKVAGALRVANMLLTDEESKTQTHTSSTADAVPLPPLGKAIYACFDDTFFSFILYQQSGCCRTKIKMYKYL